MTYIYGRHFELTTDHQALTTLFHPFKKLPVMTLHRIQRWAITLQAYNYSIRYKSTSQHANADALSRLPIGGDSDFDKQEANILCIEEIYIIMEEFPIDANVVANYTKEDKNLQKIFNYVMNGWPDNKNIENELNPYFVRRHSISIENGVLLLHNEHIRVIIPDTLRSKGLCFMMDTGVQAE